MDYSAGETKVRTIIRGFAGLRNGFGVEYREIFNIYNF